MYSKDGTRSAKCYRSLYELELPFEYTDYKDINGISRWTELHPLEKTPVAIINRDILFESAAIDFYIGDLVLNKLLIPKVGTINRARYEQWIPFG